MKPSTFNYLSDLIRKDFDSTDLPEVHGQIIDHAFNAGFKELANEMINDFGKDMYTAYCGGSFEFTPEYAKERGISTDVQTGEDDDRKPRILTDEEINIMTPEQIFSHYELLEAPCEAALETINVVRLVEEIKLTPLNYPASKVIAELKEKQAREFDTLHQWNKRMTGS